MIAAATIRAADNAYHPAYTDGKLVTAFPNLVNDKGYFYESIALELAQQKLWLWARKGPSFVGLS